MKAPTLAIHLLAGAFLCLGQAQSPAPAPAPALQAELKASSDRLAVSRAAINQQRNDRITATKAWYTTSLDKLQRDATARGDLDGVLAVKAEGQRLDRELTPEEKIALPEWLRAARGTYERALAQIADQLTVNEIAALRAHGAELDGLQKRITQAGDIDNALKVKQERALLADQIVELEKTRKPVAAAAPTAPAVKLEKPASPIAPIASSSLIPGTPAPVVEVAEEIKAKSGTKTPGAGVITFDAPPGEGRRGAKGLLLKNDPQTGKNGTTWSFQYTRDGTAYGMQIIHPHGRGQVVVHLGANKIGVSLPQDWTEVGWGAGSNKPPVKMTRESQDIFPLKGGEPYQVVSKLTSTGGLEVSIDGKIVATARITGASPLSLAIPPDKQFPNSGRSPLEFKGTDLPLQWAAGYAGILLGPLDGGVHVCRQVRFQASAFPTTR